MLDGGKGDDILNGGEGDDLLIGGRGADTYLLSLGNDTIRGFKGDDEIELSQELIDAGLSRSDVTVKTTTFDGKEAAILSYSLAGQDYTTTVIGVKDAEEIIIQKTSISSNNVKGSDVFENRTKGQNNLDKSKHDGTETWQDSDNGGENSRYFEPGDNSDTITGGELGDYIFGKKGNDVINGKGGADSLYGNQGNDTIEGGGGDDYINGGDNDDSLIGGEGEDSFGASLGTDKIIDFTYGVDKLVDSNPKTWDLVDIKSTDLNDKEESVQVKVLKNGTYEGTTTLHLTNYNAFKNAFNESNGPDLLAPLSVEGSENNDFTDGVNWHNSESIDGTAFWSYNNLNEQKFQPKNNEVEIVNGKGGDDYIFTLGQNDTINGGSGNDSLFGNTGDDEIRGDQGDDLIHGNNDNDTLRGGVGKDDLHGGSGNDRVIGDEGNDQLYGNDDNDILLGGEGSDILNGGDGDDELTGDGTGIKSQKDKFKASPGKDTITDFFFGIDELIASNDYEWDGGSVDLDSSKNSATINVLDKAFGKTVGTTVVTIKNFDQFEEIFNNSGKNPGFPPSAASDPNTKLIYKSDDKDFEAIGGQEANTITVDQIAEFANYYYEDEDRYFSKGRSDKPNTAGSDDSYSIDGHGGNDTIKGGDNDDFLHGNVGDDKLDGGPGNDRLLGGSHNDTIKGGIGNDKLFGWTGEDSLIGGEGNDLLKAEDGADTLEGGEGDDILNGGEGNDLLIGGSGADTYQLSLGNDTIRGFKGDDEIELSQELIDAGLSRSDVTVKTTTFDGKEAAILSYSLAGQDYTTTVIGVKDADDVEIENGQNFNLKFNGTDKNGKNMFRADGNKESNDNDLITVEVIDQFAKYFQEDDERYKPKNNKKPNEAKLDDLYTIDGQGGNDTLDGGNNNDSLHGASGNDLITGNGGADTLGGGSGNDTLNGGVGNDSMRGWSGQDILNGGVGNDSIYGGDGNDTLSGGAGFDQFIASKGDDTIEDFTYGVDLLVPATGEGKDYVWDRDNIALNRQRSVLIDVLSNNKGKKVGTTTIKITNYEAFLDSIGNPTPGILLPEIDDLPIFEGNTGENPNNGGDSGGGNSGGGDDDGLTDAPGNPSNDIDNSPDVPTGGDSTIDGEDLSDATTQLRTITVTEDPEASAFKQNIKGTNKAEKINGGNKDDRLIGKSGDDDIKGGKGSDYIFGDNDNDKLYGKDGDDVLQGGAGRDALKGGDGDDILYGGGGRDKITGGKGEDIFVLSSGKDIIRDFDLKLDSIGLIYALDLTFIRQDNDLLIKGNDGVSTLLKGIQKDDFLAQYPDNLQSVPAVEVDLI